MPIKVPSNLPAVETLTKENVFVMTDARAMTQDIRPLHILLLNLMPTKIETETQLTRLLGNTPLQIELELLQTDTHKAKNVSQEHMLAFYKTFDKVRNNYYDGMIITGAPVELLPFEEVEYWDELCEIMEWSKSHVHSTFHICWGAQAGLYYHYGINKKVLDKKLSGVYKHHLDYKHGMLFRGFDDIFYVPHSRNTTVDRKDIEKCKDLKIISSSEEAGVFAIKAENDRQIFIMGHSEYDWDTLQKEYIRDKDAGLNPKVPDHYYPDDDDRKEPIVRWRSCANLLYSNWLNYFVYQSTPYDISMISSGDLKTEYEAKGLKVAKFGGTSLAASSQFKKVGNIISSDKDRKFIIVSAPGKRRAGDVKITDLLLEACDDPDNIENIFISIAGRFREILRGLCIDFDLDLELKSIKENFKKNGNREYLISRGEYLSAKIMALYLGYDFIDAEDLIIFDEEGIFLEKETEDNIKLVLDSHDNGVIPGFYGKDKRGNIRSFSRGGSDITGALVAAGISAALYENWTDVSGMLLADPKIVKNPLTVPIITYKELRELAYMGAEVMHEDVIFPVREKGIPINIRNTFSPEDNGTLIVKNADYYPDILDISGISGGKGYAVFVIEKAKLNQSPEARGKVMAIFHNMGVKIQNILTGVDTLNIIVGGEEVVGKIDRLKEEIQSGISSDNIRVGTELALISVISRNMRTSPYIGARVLTALAAKGLNIKMLDYGVEGINVLIGVEESDYEFGVNAIYSEFIKR